MDTSTETPIKSVVLFVCPETGKQFKTKAGAEKSRLKAIKVKEDAKLLAEQQRLKKENYIEKTNWLRLNLENIQDIPTLLKQKMKEFWNLDCDVNVNLRFGQVSNSHGAPFNGPNAGKSNWGNQNKNLPTSYLGWSGRITGNVHNFVKPVNWYGSSVELICSHNIGFFSGTGGLGRPNDKTCNINIEFYCFLDDFPKLKEKYERYIQDEKLLSEHFDKIKCLNEAATNFAVSQTEVSELDKLIANMQSLRLETFSGYRQKFLSENEIYRPKISDDYKELEGNFK